MKHQRTRSILAFSMFMLFFLLLGLYARTYRMFPISYYDEALWIGRSYFFDFLVRRDLGNPLWESYYSYDQPKLAEYYYGAVLYPYYLQERVKRRGEYDYLTFLIDNNFYEKGGLEYPSVYQRYRANLNRFVSWEPDDYGTPSELISRHGEGMRKTVQMIFRARLANTVVLALSAVLVFLFVNAVLPWPVGFVAAILYGVNSLALRAGLVAHAEGLFFLLYHAALTLLALYFQTRRSVLLGLFALALGLLISTKLNGGMVFIMYALLEMYRALVLYNKRIWALLACIGSVAVASSAVFVLLNPFVYSALFANTNKMVIVRYRTAVLQTQYFSEASLPTPIERLMATETRFFTVQKGAALGIPLWLDKSSVAAFAGLVLFAYGVILQSLSKKKSLVLPVGLCVTLVAMSFYLQLDWERYYAPVLVFVVAYQSLGLWGICARIWSRINRLHFVRIHTRAL